MTIDKLLPVIMAGGSGTRLWPLSRESHPKQFLSLQSERSMLQGTLDRLRGLDVCQPVVICNEDHRFLVAEQLRQLGALNGNILLEPVGRNTAPAIAVAALHACQTGSDPLMLVLAADHLVSNVTAFQQAVKRAASWAAQGALVTFGITADRPETGYGYIRRGAPLADGVYRVSSFVEKPDRSTAEHYLASGEYLWNSGMFLFRASRYLEELQRFRPDILTACRTAVDGAAADMDFIRMASQAFTDCPSESVDRAVMEHTAAACVVSLDAGWSDVGEFSSLWSALPHDADGNVLRGDVLSIDSHDNLVVAENALVATLGLEGVVVIQTKDAVLVMPKSRAQDVKQVVEVLTAQGRTESRVHREVYRPWGKYDAIDVGSRYQVKRITVLPGAKLSMQMHHHRAEHWVVVRGTARVSLSGQERLLTENESIYLPLGAVHALENPGKIALELIEVQVGSYLGEDDIVRYEDLYGRA